jgi:tetratricopeptide (TPR) repeat protein
MMELKSVAAFVSLMNAYCDQPAENRAFLLSGFARSTAEIGLAVKSPWAVEQRNGGFDGQASKKAYLEVSDKLGAIGEVDLARAALEAAAALADEFLGDQTSALQIIDNALEKYGPAEGALLARGRILFHLGRHAEFIESVDPVVNGPRASDRVSRAYTFRELGIAKANLGDWAGAVSYFLRGSSAAGSADTPALSVMSVALLGDAAISAWVAGQRAEAIQHMIACLEALSTIRRDDGYREAAVYRLVGYGINLMFQTMDRPRLLDFVGPLPLAPGFISNPDPARDFGNGPVLTFDVFWHILAHVELSAGTAPTISRDVWKWPPERQVMTFMAMLAAREWAKALKSADVAALKNIAPRALAAHVLMKLQPAMFSSNDLSNPVRGAPPLMPLEYMPEVRMIIEADLFVALASILLQFGVATADGFLDWLGSEEARLLAVDQVSIVRGTAPSAPPASMALIDCVAVIRKHLAEGRIPTVEELFAVGLRFFEGAKEDHLQFVGELVRVWSAGLWPGVALSQSFRLRTPNVALDAITGVLANLPEGRMGLARLLRAVAPYLSIRLSEDVATNLRDASGE